MRQKAYVAWIARRRACGKQWLARKKVRPWERAIVVQMRHSTTLFAVARITARDSVLCKPSGAAALQLDRTRAVAGRPPAGITTHHHSAVRHRS
jgi:hypothetical protein